MKKDNNYFYAIPSFVLKSYFSNFTLIVILFLLGTSTAFAQEQQQNKATINTTEKTIVKAVTPTPQASETTTTKFVEKKDLATPTYASFDFTKFKAHTDWESLDATQQQRLIERLRMIKQTVHPDTKKAIDNYLSTKTN